MKTLLAMVVAALALVPAASRAKDASKHSTAAKPTATFLNADELKWGEASPDLPKGAQIAVLHGDPSKKAPFAIRLKAPDGYKIAPHWHTQDEQLTVISGTLKLHMGDTWDAPSHDLKAGSFHFLPGKMHHAAEANGEVVVQVNGMGPFDIHYLNPADNPNPAVAKGGAQHGHGSGAHAKTAAQTR